jgi:hypothetical protein
MNAKLGTAISQEMGCDDGREMHDFAGIKWTIDRLDLYRLIIDDGAKSS